jgi:hypothetical protein
VNQLASAARTPDVRAASTTASSRQIPALDGIRGLAIIWVVLHNATDEEFAAGGVFHLLTLLTHPGWIGVPWRQPANHQRPLVLRANHAPERVPTSDACEPPPPHTHQRPTAPKPYPRLRKLRASRCNLLILSQFDCRRQANWHDNRKESRQPATCTASEFAGIVAIPSGARRGKQT